MLVGAGLLVFFFLFSAVIPVSAQQIGESCTTEGARSGDLVCLSGLWGPPEGTLESPADIVNLVRTITNWVFAILMAASVIFIILAGFQFVMEGKDPAKVAEARTKLIYAVAGITIALLANGFEALLRNLLGVT